MKNLIILLAFVSLFTSCVTYKKCQEKFQTSNTITDSVRVMVPVPVTVIVPKDSVVTVFKTDSTPFYKEVQSGRAKLTFSRTKRTTSVKAECLPDTIYQNKKVYIKTPGQQIVWGVAPWYKTAFRIIAPLLLCCLALLAFLFFHKPHTEPTEKE